ncbi:hypothetical protein AVEN_43035-1 [Araneus ventricosus]|uniref:EGF-like domain-containing protein n=1 Tax=Araneus ventricosus TaxID=182803 RepID=A0A4Y2JJ70_ARAVE|nr:hypothetical protein AVEN_43035-1 [Araneus ventricosus]
MTRTTPELAPPSPNFRAKPTGGRLATTYDLACNRPHTRRIFSGIGFRTCDPPNGSSEKLNSHKHLLEGKSFSLYNEVYNQEKDVFEDSLQNNADLNLEENHVDESIKLQQNSNAYSFADEGIHPLQRAFCSCRNGKCVTEDRKEVCKCNPGYGYFTSSVCKACDCGPNQGCKWKSTGWFGSEQICFCNPGYLEDNGKCVVVPCTDESQCSDRQKCVGEEDGEKTCQCDDGLGGENCDKEEWCEDPGKFKNCKGQYGKCEYSKERRSVVCTCDNGKKFLPKRNICKTISCINESQCSERQKCVGEEIFKTCQCDDGLGGENCEIQVWCEDTGKFKNCKDEYGKCEYSKEKRSVACTCDNGKKLHPEENICKAVPCTEESQCNERQKCVGEEGEKTCQCDDGLGGENCEIQVWCEDPGKFKNCIDEYGKCEYSKEKRSVVCTCDNGKKFHPEENICKGKIQC